jgi:tRNA pseudouridine38-40 synthase
MRLVLGIEYDGSGYCGWQRQSHSPSVQQHVEKALSFVADHAVELTCAGRTDTGVHACEQIAHFDTESVRSERSWVLGSNCRLPRDIRILWIREIDADFHARFRAVARSYRYAILNTPVPSAIFNNKVCWEHHSLDHAKMHHAAQQLVGEHDFSSFRAAGCQARSPVKYVHWIEVTPHQKMVSIDIKANAFLHHMVRNIAGSLMAIGKAEQSEQWLGEILLERDRKQAAMTAFAGGLYFVKAYYPEQYDLPNQESKPVFF